MRKRNAPPTVFERLQKRIKAELGTDCHNFHRSYAGRNMRASGAPLWRATIVGSHYEVSGTIPASELLKVKVLYLDHSGIGEFEVREKLTSD